MLVRRSKYADLKAAHDLAVEQLGEAREELADWKGSAIRVAGRNGELQRRLDASRDVAFLDTEYVGQLEARLARVLRACVRYRASLAADTRRADRLQARLDDAVGLHHGGHIRDSAQFQPGYQKPKGDRA